MPKPNIRFLRNIIRETDNHNASLLAREADQSRSRLRALSPSGRASKSSHTRLKEDHLSDDDNRRHRKRRRVEEAEKDAPVSSRRHRKEKPRSKRREEDATHETRHGGSWSGGPQSHDQKFERVAEEKTEIEGESERPKKRPRSRRKRKRHTSREDVSDHEGHQDRVSRRHRSRTRSPTPDREERRSRRQQRRRRKRSRSGSANPRPQSPSRLEPGVGSTGKASDSDPLEAFVGPAPPRPEPVIQSRGRGTFRSTTAAIDSHFAENYDPRADVQLYSEPEDDWDQALEALRDRQKWKQQGADRLRAAGFTQDEIDKWSKSGEKREDDVRWVKRGEDREWDRGKVVNPDGDVLVKTKWRRLKGLDMI